MGIKGLLPALKSITQKIDHTYLEGKVVGVDARSWLYKAAMADPKLSAQGYPGNAFKSYLSKRLRWLKQIKINDVIFVFDGCECAAKRSQSKVRKNNKDQNLSHAMHCEHEGDYDGADGFYKRSISISFEQTQSFMDMLREKELAYLVAPFEADAQLAYLSKINAIDVVISEDSDMLVYGCKEVLYKLDALGKGDLICYSDLERNVGMGFKDWSAEQFTLFSCLAGCDYVESLPKIGIKTAHVIASKYSSLTSVLDCVRTRYHAGPDYCHRLQYSYWTFRHHIVYCPMQGKINPLNPLEDSDVPLEEIMGKNISPSILPDLVRGHIDPSSVDAIQEDKIECFTISSLSECSWPIAHGEGMGHRGTEEGANAFAWTSAEDHLRHNQRKSPAKECKPLSLHKAHADPKSGLPRFESCLVSRKLIRLKRKKENTLQPLTIPTAVRDRKPKALEAISEAVFDECDDYRTIYQPHTSETEKAINMPSLFFDRDIYYPSEEPSFITSYDTSNIDRSLLHIMDKPVSNFDMHAPMNLYESDLRAVEANKRYRVAHLLGET